MPTINMLNTPDDLAPVNKELWFRVNSASSSVSDFKYVFRVNEKVEPFTNSYSSITTYKIPPRPTTGDGLYSPHKLLKSFFDYNPSPYANGWYKVDEGLVKYYLDYGFEYNPSIIWADTVFSGGFVGLTFSSPHGLLAEDIITLNKDNKVVNPEYDGTASITSVPNTYQIVTDIPWGDDTTDESGTITSLYRLTATSSEHIAYNGTRQYDERNTDFTNTYTLVNSNSKFLTNYNQTYKSVFGDNYETISMILDNTTGYDFIVKTYDSSLSPLATYTYSILSNNDYKRMDFGVGPQNLEELESGITTGVKYYDVWVEESGATVSETRSYRIDTNCSPYDNVRMMFLNRAGGWDFFNFTLDSKKKVNIQRSEYNRIMDWDYTIGDRGRTNLATKADETWTITSDWISEKDSIWLEELLTSPEVYHITNGTFSYVFDTKIQFGSYSNNGGNTRVNSTLSPHGLSVGDYIKFVDTASPYNNQVVEVIQINSTTSFTVDYPYSAVGMFGADGIRKRLYVDNTGSQMLPVILTDSSYQTKTALRDRVFNLVVNFRYAYNTNLQNQ